MEVLGDWRKDSLSDPCAFALAVVPPALLVPCGTQTAGKTIKWAKGNQLSPDCLSLGAL